MSRIKIIAAVIVATLTFMLAVPSFADSRWDYIPTLDISLRKEIQLRLKREGFFNGVVDGRIGATSKSAIERYRRAKNIVEIEEAGDGAKPFVKTLYLTPKFIKSLFGVDFDTESDELYPENQLKLLKLIKPRQSDASVGPDE